MKIQTARDITMLRRGRNDWYRIENKTSAKPKVYIYSEIGYFGVTAQDFVKDLNDLDADEIELRLNTPGGNVFDGLAIYNALRDHDATITATVDGIAASAGSFIFQAGDTRIMNRSTELMIHNASGLAIGTAKDMREMAETLDRLSKDVASIYVDRGGLELDDVLAAMEAETWYSADEAVEAGLADEVSGKEADADDSFDLSIYSYAGRRAAPAPQIPAKPNFDYAAAVNALTGAFK